VASVSLIGRKELEDNRLVHAANAFDAAIDAMATSTLSLQDRLLDAANRLSTLKSEDFPIGPLRESFDTLQRELGPKRDDKDKPRRGARTNVTDDEAQRIARSIVDLGGALRSARAAFGPPTIKQPKKEQ
jgi:hypothetical protein